MASIGPFFRRAAYTAWLAMLAVWPVGATAQGLVDTYLQSFEDKYSAEFTEAAFCAGVVYDIGMSLGSTGLADGNQGLVRLSEKIVERSQALRDDVALAFMFEISPDLEPPEGVEVPDHVFDRANEAVDTAFLEVADSEEYYFVLDFISFYEWLGLYAYCSEVYTPDGWLSSDISVSAILAEDGMGGFVKNAIAWTVDQGQLVVDWTESSYHTIASLDVCEGDLDTLGGIAIGTAATATFAGESALVVIGSSTILVATAPAIATGVTVSALTGATIFVTAKGYCYFAA